MRRPKDSGASLRPIASTWGIYVAKFSRAFFHPFSGFHSALASSFRLGSGSRMLLFVFCVLSFFFPRLASFTPRRHSFFFESKTLPLRHLSLLSLRGI